MLRQHSPNLRRLYLDNVVLKAPVPDTLELLSISNSTVWPSCFPAPRPDAAGGQGCLRVVEMSHVQLKVSSLRALPDSVERLKIEDTVLTQQCMHWQPHMPEQAHLRELDLSRNTWSHWMILAVIFSVLPQLTTLKLNGVLHYAVPRVALVPHLEVLEVEDNSISGTALRAICTRLTLRRLSLARCLIWDSNDFLLLASLRNTLRYLNVSGTNITADILNVLTTCMPNCHIVF